MMKDRYIKRRDVFDAVPEVDAFFDEIMEVCRRHGMSIHHDECGGRLIVREYNEELMEWLAQSDDWRGRDL